MKIGYRKPNLKKSFKARTTGKIKRKMKKAVNPFYGKKGMGYIKNPQRAVKNKIYHKTTFGTTDVVKAVTNTPGKKTNNSSANTTMNAKGINPIAYTIIVFFFGIFGVHKFIDGSVGMGILYLCTGGICGIGWIIDLIKAIIVMSHSKENTDFLLDWQKVILTDSPDKLVMTKKQLQESTEMQANNDIRIIQDSIKLISETVKPDVFFSRLDLLKEHAQHLTTLEPFANFSESPTAAFNEVIDNEQEAIYQFIIRYYNSVDTYANTLKTDKGKANQYQKFYDSLMNYRDIMNEENIKYIEYKYNQSKN